MNKGNHIKAIALLSGGLDSALAAKLVLEQGISLLGLQFTSPFCQCNQKGKCHAAEIAKNLGIPWKMVSKGEDYLKVVRNPSYGYGSGMNPCIDCRIFMLRKAQKIAEDVGAKFIVTGEVLGQRPMSQHLRALKIIDRESGLEGRILRPLSARLLPETLPEKNGWVDRQKLLAIEGRSRRPQLSLANDFSIKGYACAAGGCLLTMEQFARKLKDLFRYKKRVTYNDIALLKVGRHFRSGRSKIICGRDKIENQVLRERKQKSDYLLEVLGCGSPVTLLQGPKAKTAITTAAGITAHYSDCKEEKVLVRYGRLRPVKGIKVIPADQKEVNRLNLSL